MRFAHGSVLEKDVVENVLIEFELIAEVDVCHLGVSVLEEGIAVNQVVNHILHF